MLKTFKVHYVLSNSNYLTEINRIFFRKILPGFNFAGLNFPQNIQGFKFEKKKKKKEMWCTCFSRHMTTASTF